MNNTSASDFLLYKINLCKSGRNILFVIITLLFSLFSGSSFAQSCGGGWSGTILQIGWCESFLASGDLSEYCVETVDSPTYGVYQRCLYCRDYDTPCDINCPTGTEKVTISGQTYCKSPCDHFSERSGIECTPYPTATSTPQFATDPVPDQCGGNPILYGTGSKVQTETDFSSLVVPLAIRRQYVAENGVGQWKWSYDQARYLSPIEEQELTNDLALGDGSSGSSGGSQHDFVVAIWHEVPSGSEGDAYCVAELIPANRCESHYDYRSISANIASPATGYRLLYAYRENGARLAFFYEALTNSWVAAGRPNVTLVEVVNNGVVEFLLTTETNEKEVYNLNGQLLSITDIYKQTQTLQYIEDDDGLPDLDRLVVTDDATGLFITYEYNNDGQIVVAKNTANQSYTYTYNSINNQLETVTFPDMETVTYQYNDANHSTALTAIIDEESRSFASWAYDPLTGKAISSQHGTGFEQIDFSYTVDEDGNVTQAVLENAEQRQTTFTLNKIKGRNLVQSIDGVTDGTGVCLPSNSTYTYDENGFRLTHKDSKGYIIRTERNNRNLIETEYRGLDGNEAATLATQKIETLWDNSYPQVELRTYYGWDGFSYEPYRSEDPVYDPVIDPNNRITGYTVTDLTTITSPYNTYGRTRTWNYNYTYFTGTTLPETITIDGPLTTADGLTNDNDDYTVYTYNNEGELISITNALGQQVTLDDYNPQGRPGKITDANNVVTTLSYTARGWIESVTVNDIDPLDPNDGATTGYTYYANGTIKKVTLPDGSTLEYTYNDARHLITVKNNLNETIVLTPNVLDGRWTLMEIKDATNTLVEKHNRAFDELGRLKTIVNFDINNPQQTEVRYDANNNLNTIDEWGHADYGVLNTTYSYDQQNRLQSITDANLNNTIISYDGQGNINNVLDARLNETSYLYDGFGQLIQRISPDTGTTIYEYDTAGNLTSVTDNRMSSTITQYDLLGRADYQSYLDVGQNPTADYIDWVYDLDTAAYGKGIGRLVKIVDNSGIQEYQYNAFGQITEHRQILNKVGGGTLSTSTVYHFDAIGKPTGMTYPGGHQSNYTYDGNEQLSSVNYNGSPLASNMVYHPFSRLTGFTYGNNLSLAQSLDINGRFESQQVTDLSAITVIDLGYIYDAFNNITDITNNIPGASNQTLHYDRLHRLDHAAGYYGNYQYGYDAVGNRESRYITPISGNDIAETYNVDPDSNQLDSVTRTIGGSQTMRSMIYDDAGNISVQSEHDGRTSSMDYNEQNRLIKTTITPAQP